MAKVAGQGGYWVVDTGDAVADVHNAEYEVDVEGVNEDTTDSDSGGWAAGDPVLKKVNSVTMSVAEDDTAYPQALGLTEGQRVDIWLKRGSLDEFNKVTGTLVRNVRESNPQNGIRRVSIACEYGVYERGVGAPA